jgi:GT2 family glycosyltransferase
MKKIKINPDFKLIKNQNNYFLTKKNDLSRGFILDKPAALIFKNLNNPNFLNQELKKRPLYTKALLKILIKNKIIQSPPLINLIEEENFEFKQPDKLKKTKNLPGISIVILNFNGENHLKDCLRSIINQNYENLEIIIVDNLSQDKSIPILKKYQKKYPQLIELNILSKGVSFSEGNNIGIKKSKYEYIFLLNNDTKLEKNCLINLGNKIKKEEKNKTKWGIISLKMRLFYFPQIINSIGVSVKKKNFGYDNFLGATDFGQYDQVKDILIASFGACVIKKDLIKKIGYMDKNYWFYYEDADYSLRTWLAGHQILTSPDSVVLHKFSASSNSRKGFLFKIRLALSNRQYYVIKNFNLKNLILFEIHYLKEDILKFLHYLIKTREFDLCLTYFKAYLRLIYLIPQALMKKIEINKLKKQNKKLNEDQILKKNKKYLPYTEGNFIRLDKEIIKTYYTPLLFRDKIVKFGFLGHGTFDKGFELLITSFYRIQKDFKFETKAQLYLFGDFNSNQLSKKTLNLIKILEEKNLLKIKGPYQREAELKKIIDEIDMVIMPSLWNETFGLVLNEAFKYKTPAIVSDKGALPERLIHQKNGLIFKTEKKDDLKNKLQTIIDNPDLIQKFKQNIKAPKSFEKHGEEIYQLLKNL